MDNDKEISIENFTEYMYGFKHDIKDKLLLETLVLIATEIRGISTRMLILHKTLKDINKSLEEMNG